MTNADHQELGLLAKAVIAVAVVLLFIGFVWHGAVLARPDRAAGRTDAIPFRSAAVGGNDLRDPRRS
jgi:hypothetical protein